jgi:hypothetical protein
MMSAMFYISRGVLAVLVALGMQLPCPCPSMAEAGNTSVSEQDAESCCPGSKEQEADDEQAPAHDDGHVCSHCNDDQYTKAATSIELVKSSDWIHGDSHTFDQLASVSAEARHLQEDGSEYRLDRPPPERPTVVDSGRDIRILYSSFLC